VFGLQKVGMSILAHSFESILVHRTADISQIDAQYDDLLVRAIVPQIRYDNPIPDMQSA
jgi:hypothetical protein